MSFHAALWHYKTAIHFPPRMSKYCESRIIEKITHLLAFMLSCYYFVALCTFQAFQSLKRHILTTPLLENKYPIKGGGSVPSQKGYLLRHSVKRDFTNSNESDSFRFCPFWWSVTLVDQMTIVKRQCVEWSKW